MIAVDTNILVYAHREESPQHVRALDAPGERFWTLLRAALEEAGGTGNLVLDARSWPSPASMA